MSQLKLITAAGNLICLYYLYPGCTSVIFNDRLERNLLGAILAR